MPFYSLQYLFSVYSLLYMCFYVEARSPISPSEESSHEEARLFQLVKRDYITTFMQTIDGNIVCLHCDLVTEESTDDCCCTEEADTCDDVDTEDLTETDDPCPPIVPCCIKKKKSTCAMLANSSCSDSSKLCRYLSKKQEKIKKKATFLENVDNTMSMNSLTENLLVKRLEQLADKLGDVLSCKGSSSSIRQQKQNQKQKTDLGMLNNLDNILCGDAVEVHIKNLDSGSEKYISRSKSGRMAVTKYNEFSGRRKSSISPRHSEKSDCYCEPDYLGAVDVTGYAAHGEHGRRSNLSAVTQTQHPDALNKKLSTINEPNAEKDEKPPCIDKPVPPNSFLQICKFRKRTESVSPCTCKSDKECICKSEKQLKKERKKQEKKEKKERKRRSKKGDCCEDCSCTTQANLPKCACEDGATQYSNLTSLKTQSSGVRMIGNTTQCSEEYLECQRRFEGKNRRRGGKKKRRNYSTSSGDSSDKKGRRRKNRRHRYDSSSEEDTSSASYRKARRKRRDINQQTSRVHQEDVKEIEGKLVLDGKEVPVIVKISKTEIRHVCKEPDNDECRRLDELFEKWYQKIHGDKKISTTFAPDSTDLSNMTGFSQSDINLEVTDDVCCGSLLKRGPRKKSKSVRRKSSFANKRPLLPDKGFLYGVPDNKFESECTSSNEIGADAGSCDCDCRCQENSIFHGPFHTAIRNIYNRGTCVFKNLFGKIESLIN